MFKKDKIVDTLDNYVSSSRYSISTMFYDVKDKSYFLELPKSLDVPSTFDDSTYRVEHKHVNRLDLMANMFYGDSKLWWVIAEANHLDNPTVIPYGTTLKIPGISSIFGVGGVLE
jgi:hypothetical protein